MCDNVGEWAVEHQGAECHVLFPPQPIRWQLPRTVDPQLLPQYAQRRDVGSQRGRYIVPVHNARILGRNGLVVLPGGSYAAESIYGPNLLSREIDYVAPPRRRVVRMPGSYFPLLVVHFATPGHYYHWVHDVLTRLYGLMDHLAPETKFIISPDLSPLQQETLRLVGVDEDRTVTFDPHEIWELDTLWFANPTTYSGWHLRAVDVWLRDRILGGFGLTPGPPERRIFVSRSRMRSRRLTNEADVVALLSEYGFETCTPETMDLRAQAAQFARAEAVVSTHGSAFTNALFSPPGLKLVDMIEPSMFENAPTFWSMAEELGHEYWYFTAEPVPRPGQQPDTYVSVEKLAATLEAMGLAR